MDLIVHRRDDRIPGECSLMAMEHSANSLDNGRKMVGQMGFELPTSLYANGVERDQTPDAKDDRHVLSNGKFRFYKCSTDAPLEKVRAVLKPITEHEPLVLNDTAFKRHPLSDIVGCKGSTIIMHTVGNEGEPTGTVVEATGNLANRAARLIRESGISHRVAQVDVCIDFIGDYDLCHSLFRAACRGTRFQPKEIGMVPAFGTNRYRRVSIGKPWSGFQAKMWESGAMLGANFPANLVTLEFRFQPTSEQSELFSKMDGAEMIGLRNVSTELFSSILEEDSTVPYQLILPDHVEIGGWCTDLCKRELMRLYTRCESWTEVGKYLGREMRLHDSHN
jgi:hypothetical protein